MKKVISAILAFVFVISVVPSAFATEQSQEAISYYICYSETGEILSYNMPYDIFGVSRAEDHTYLKTTVLGRGSVQNEDLGYHPATNIWRKVSSYSFSNSETTNVSFTLAWGGKNLNASIGISASSSTSFSYTITADQSRYSKIHVYCDYDYVVNQGEVRDQMTEEVYRTFTYTTITKTAEDFRVEYRQ